MRGAGRRGVRGDGRRGVRGDGRRGMRRIVMHLLTDNTQGD